jgi:hypothetical protein
MSLIQNHLRWSPGSGKEIEIWEDHFSDRGKLSCITTLDSLGHWLTSKGKITLFDISEWKSNRAWKNWNLREVPSLLLNEAHQFLLFVSSSAPVHLNQKDSRD